MPPPREQPNPPSRRRRPDVMPGGWLWLVLLLLLVGILYFTLVPTSGRIDYSLFMDLAKQKQFSRVDLVGNNRIVGEIPEDKELDERIKNKARSRRLDALIPESAIRSGQVTKELDSYGIPYGQQEEHGAWLSTLLVLILP